MQKLGKISGTGNSETRFNEITNEDVALFRDFVFGATSGIFSGVVSSVVVNEVADVTFSINGDGELIINEPTNYQGTEFNRVGDELIATTPNGVPVTEIRRVENELIVEEVLFYE